MHSPTPPSSAALPFAPDGALVPLVDELDLWRGAHPCAHCGKLVPRSDAVMVAGPEWPEWVMHPDCVERVRWESQ